MGNRTASSKPTIRDVAAEAGVSIATVSRALNGRAPIAPETARRVQAAVAALGFRANRTGRELRAGSSHTVGVLVPSLANPVFAESVSGIQDAAREAGWSVLIASSAYEAQRESEAIDNLAAGRDATRAMIAAGHTRLAMVAGRFAASDRSKQRYRGFVQALTEHGLEIGRAHV